MPRIWPEFGHDRVHQHRYNYPSSNCWSGNLKPIVIMNTAAQLRAMMQKAVAHHQIGQLPEAKQSYLDVLKLDPLHGDALRLLGGLYVQQNEPQSAVGCLEKAISIKPDNAELHNNLGVALYRLQKLDEAIQHYQKAILINPHYEEALNNLSNLLYRRGNWLRNAGRSEEACGFYQKLVTLRPQDVNAHLNLGTIYHDLGKFDAALDKYNDVLRLEPTSVDAMINRGSVLTELDRADEALDSYEQALRLQPQSLDAKWGSAVALLTLGQYSKGWALYETRHLRKPMKESVPFQSKRWDGSPIPGKRLLIWSEQGLGDTLQFIRYAALCKEKVGPIIVLCPAPLVRLLKNCPFIDKVVTTATESDFDAQVSVMSLPHIFGTTLPTIPQTIPYLFVSKEARQKWAQRFRDIEGYKVGLVWAGNPRKGRIDAHVTDRQRSMGLALMKPLIALEQCRFYSLQKGESAKDIDVCGLKGSITDYMPEVTDFMDTAALIENLDLVISVDTSVVHLVGGLGKPVWVLSRFGGCWRWLRNQELSPWYPTARIFGQSSPFDWSGCVGKIVQALENQGHTGKL